MDGKEYTLKTLQKIEERHADKPEFIQAVRELFMSLLPYIEQNPEVAQYNLLELIAEPERIIQFRVPWEDDDGNWQVNLAWRVQYNSTLGPYKGGIRFDPSVNESILRFLGFEQTFKNALTRLPLGGGKGGSDFNPVGKSDREIMRFVQSFMTELHRYLGPELDVPAGDIGVHHREISYMYGQYKRLQQPQPGVLTGKPVNHWGSNGRTEATGYGVIYFAQAALEDRKQSLKGKKVVVSGSGTVGFHTMEKAVAVGAKLVAFSDHTGYTYDENGIDVDLIRKVRSVDNVAAQAYAAEVSTATFFENKSVWDAEFEYDIAFPAATQNEINKKQADNMIENCKITAIFEGANMPNTDSAVKAFKENDILFAPGKAVNAGGVAVSALEMAQNAQREQWTFEEVDTRLQKIMKNIYQTCNDTAEKYADKNDLQAGANIASFEILAQATIEQGLV